MSRRVVYAMIIVVALFGAAQLIRPDLSNPPTNPSHVFGAQLHKDSGLVVILDRSCFDCHANATAWPRYTQVAPLSWLRASAVRKGREVLNFSEWSNYSPDVQRALLAASCTDATQGKMPGIYAQFKPEAKLSPKDIETICAAAH